MKNKHFSRIIICIIIFSNTLSAQQSKSIRLNENWKFLKSDLGGIWEAVRPFKEGNPESVPLWETVTLPHCFNAKDAVDSDVNYYQGPGWYKNQIEIKNPYKNGRTILHFEGAGQKTEVYVYTTKVGSHVGGYNEWTVDITDAVKIFVADKEAFKRFGGKIPISIRCDNSRDLEMIPSDMSDFNVYGGIYRYLNLVYQPEIYMEDVFIDASVDDKGKEGAIKLDIDLKNYSSIKDVNFKIEIVCPKGKVITSEINEDVFEGFKNIYRTTIKNPDLWSTSQPNLYTCNVTLSSEAGKQINTIKFGFRSFEFLEKGPFKLNGERLLLRGTHRHEDHANVGAAMTEEMITEEMVMMKEMGVNFIRLGHYQQSRIVLNLCDSLGILVWEEIPWCRGGLGGDVYKEQARNMLTDMIQQHRNHPSIIIWGLGNENDWPGDFSEFDKEKIRDFMSELNSISHRIDPTRKTAIRRCDFCRDIVDVYSPSIWAGWYRGLYSEYKEETEKQMSRVKHFLHVEWGGDSHAGRHSEDPDEVLKNIESGQGTDERLGDASLVGGEPRVSKDGDWSETYACNLIDWHLKEQENMPYLSGSAYWPFKDFSTPVRPENPIPYMNQKGVVQRDFTKKESYYVFQSWWTETPMAHIYGHDWPIRWGNLNDEKMVKVYSNCDTAELFVNGQSVGVKTRNKNIFPAAGLFWKVVYKEGENTLKVVAKKGKVTVFDEIKQLYQTEKWNKPYKMDLKIIAKDSIQATIEVSILDENNVLCLDSTNFVTFGITGDGILIDNLGTASGSRKVAVHNGKATISIKLNEGPSIASVKSDGIPTVFIDLRD